MHNRERPIAAAQRNQFGAAAVSTAAAEPTTFACASDPDRWTTNTDEGAKALCRACPRRWLCAQEACEVPGAQGLWAGIVIPEAGRGRMFALKQLRSLADQNGFPVLRRPA